MLLFKGRTVAECPDYSFKSPDGVFRLSWLCPHEIIELKTELDSFEGILNGDEDAVIAVNLLKRALTEAEQSGGSLLVTIA
jgi:hypothetical protein